MRSARSVLAVVYLLGILVSSAEIVYGVASGLTGHGGWRFVLYGMFGAFVFGGAWAQNSFAQRHTR